MRRMSSQAVTGLAAGPDELKRSVRIVIQCQGNDRFLHVDVWARGASLASHSIRNRVLISGDVAKDVSGEFFIIIIVSSYFPGQDVFILHIHIFGYNLIFPINFVDLFTSLLIRESQGRKGRNELEERGCWLFYAQQYYVNYQV